MTAEETSKGSCLCGAVRFSVRGEMMEADACHCSDCRKFSGHYFVSAGVDRSKLQVEGLEHVRWFSLSEKVRRGFCNVCGSSLFWDPIEHDYTAIALGAFDDVPKTRVVKHIWVADKPSYYQITDGLPQRDEY